MTWGRGAQGKYELKRANCGVQEANHSRLSLPRVGWGRPVAGRPKVLLEEG